MNAEIDFNDGEIQLYRLEKGIHSFKKEYNTSGLFTINVRIKNHSINLNPSIFSIFKFYFKFYKYYDKNLSKTRIISK